MAVLKTLHKLINRNYRVKGSTLMETLVATVLIIVIFLISSMIMNNLFSNAIKSNTRAIDTHISELKYLQINDKLELPYQADYKNWSIEIFNTKINEETTVTIEAFNTKTKQNITQSIFETK